MAVKTTGGIISDGANDLQSESNWTVFKEGSLSNLKFIEALYSLDKGNRDMLFGLVKGYTGYGFGVYETLYLDDFYKENDAAFNKNQALYFYSKAIDYGWQFLATYDLTFQQVLDLSKDTDKYIKTLNDKLGDSPKDLETVFFFAQALGSSINLQKTEPSMVSLLSIVEPLIRWACKKDPKLSFGSCDLFYGAFEAGRPKMLGGNLEKGKTYFQKVMKEYPQNALAQVSYLQYYVLPVGDQDEYKRVKESLLAQFEENNKTLLWRPSKQLNPSTADKNLNLFNSIAEKRLQIIMDNEKKLF
ncbi:MAG: TRAP transporter TatT component family protein [Bacteriovoracaceae bacterium]